MVENVKTKVWRYNKKTKVRLEFEVDEEKDVAEHRIDINKSWLLSYLMEWVDWDYSPTIDLVAAAFENLGKGMISFNSHTNGVKYGRRAIYAAHMLRKAYSDNMNLDTNDKSYINWSKRHRFVWKRDGKWGVLTCAYDYKNAMNMAPAEYADKMYKIICARMEKVKKSEKKFCWEYIHKYIEHWWD